MFESYLSGQYFSVSSSADHRECLPKRCFLLLSCQEICAWIELITSQFQFDANFLSIAINSSSIKFILNMTFTNASSYFETVSEVTLSWDKIKRIPSYDEHFGVALFTRCVRSICTALNIWCLSFAEFIISFTVFINIIF